MENKKNICAGDLEIVCSGFFEKLIKSFPIIICFSIPAILLIGAYLYMSIIYQKPWLFNTVVHENGKYSLLEVIFYFRHFTWEILGKAVYSCFIVGVFYYYGNALSRRSRNVIVNIPQSRILLSGFLVFSIVVLSIIATSYKFGFKEAMLGFSQYRTSEIRLQDFGSHWRNHFLSNIVLFSASAFFVLLYRIVFFGGYWVKRRYSNLFFISSGAFIFLAVFFGFTKDPFATASYLGHQLREIFGSDLPITMLLAIGLLIYLEERYDNGREKIKVERQENHNNVLCLIYWSLPFIFISSFLVLKILSLDISANITKIGSTENWSVLDVFARHFFEHSLDYLFVVSFVYFLYLFTVRMEFKKIIVDD